MQMNEGKYMNLQAPKDYPFTNQNQVEPISAVAFTTNNNSLKNLDEGLYKNARTQFIRKVYTIVLIQLLITTALCFVSYYVPSFLQFQVENFWLMILLMVLMIVVEIVIICLPIGRKAPWNLLLLFVFTLSFSYMISSSCALVAIDDGPATVVVAALITAVIVIGLTLYAVFAEMTGRSFGVMIAIIIVCTLSMLTMAIISIFTQLSPFWTNFYCALGVIVFGIYLIIDTKMIVGGDDRFGLQLSIDDYVIGALIIYIDIIQIFLYILEMLSSKK